MIIRLQGVTEYEFADEKDSEKKYFNFFPEHVMSELTIGLVLMVILTALAASCRPRWAPRPTRW